MADILDVMFVGFGPFSWWKDCIKDIITAWLSIKWSKLILLGAAFGSDAADKALTVAAALSSRLHVPPFAASFFSA